VRRGGAIRYVAGGRIEEIRDLDPTIPLLDYLRIHRRRTGTKEGCAEGDCGACTVVLAELRGRGLRYRAVNACIHFLAMIDGKALITVEDLASAGENGRPHPVQCALAAHHGSQCGFCTPGFAMSLFALGKTRGGGGPPDRAVLDEALAGNLCRCTGYLPIARAARGLDPGAPDRFAREEDETIALLRRLRRRRGLAYRAGTKRFLAPRDTDEAAAILTREAGATIVAGATDAGLWITKEGREIETVVWLGAARDLARVELGDEALVIGGAATYADAMPALTDAFPATAPMLKRLGSVQIRNMGTIGGNLANASPIGDLAPLLIALDARLDLRRGDARRGIAVEDFFTGYRETLLAPGEFIEAIRIPCPAPGVHLAVHKVSKRFDEDISTVLGAFSLTLEDGVARAARIGMGGLAATPARARLAEAAILGQPWTKETVEGAKRALAIEFAPITDMRASARYRALVAGRLLDRLLIETTAPEIATDVRRLAVAAGG